MRFCCFLISLGFFVLGDNIPNPTGNNYTICSWNTIIIDPSRLHHRIPLNIHYPCNNTNTYPLMIFGHASQSQNTWYNYLWEILVPQGYIIIMPGSYEYINDSHLLFAADMLYTLAYMYDICNTSISCPLYNTIMNKSLVSGHSLGGASSLLIAGNNMNINETFNYQFNGMLTLSGCGVDSTITNYTNASINVNIPSLLLTGSSDCLCNPPYYESIISYYNNIPNNTCKYLGVISNATHCHFESNSITEDDTCTIIEDIDCINGPFPDFPHKIDRDTQLNIVNTYFALFMYQILYNNNNINLISNQLNNDMNNGVMDQIGINC